MATAPASSISGVVSGIKSRDLVGQIRAVEKPPTDSGPPKVRQPEAPHVN